MSDEFKYYNRSYGMTRLDNESVHQGISLILTMLNCSVTSV